MKHAPLFDKSNNIATFFRYDGGDADRIKEAKVLFYKNYSFLDLMSIVRVENMAYTLIIKFHHGKLLKMRDTNHKNLVVFLNAVLQFELRKDVIKHIFEKLNADYLHYISLHEDRKLYLKDINDYVCQ